MVPQVPWRPMLVAIWLMLGAVFGFFSGWLAIRKNRSASAWFMSGLLFGPIALVAILTREHRDAPAFL